MNASRITVKSIPTPDAIVKRYSYKQAIDWATKIGFVSGVFFSYFVVIALLAFDQWVLK